jgi:hypothetical protein
MAQSTVTLARSRRETDSFSLCERVKVCRGDSLRSGVVLAGFLRTHGQHDAIQDRIPDQLVQLYDARI